MVYAHLHTTVLTSVKAYMREQAPITGSYNWLHSAKRDLTAKVVHGELNGKKNWKTDGFSFWWHIENVAFSDTVSDSPCFLIIFLTTAPNGSSQTIFKNIFIIRTLQSCLPVWLFYDVLNEREDGSNVSWKLTREAVCLLNICSAWSFLTPVSTSSLVITERLMCWHIILKVEGIVPSTIRWTKLTQ